MLLYVDWLITLSNWVHIYEMRDMLSICISKEFFRVNSIKVGNQSVDQKKVTFIVMWFLLGNYDEFGWIMTKRHIKVWRMDQKANSMKEQRLSEIYEEKVKKTKDMRLASRCNTDLSRCDEALFGWHTFFYLKVCLATFLGVLNFREKVMARVIQGAILEHIGGQFFHRLWWWILLNSWYLSIYQWVTMFL